MACNALHTHTQCIHTFIAHYIAHLHSHFTLHCTTLCTCNAFTCSQHGMHHAHHDAWQYTVHMYCIHMFTVWHALCTRNAFTCSQHGMQHAFDVSDKDSHVHDTLTLRWYDGIDCMQGITCCTHALQTQHQCQHTTCTWCHHDKWLMHFESMYSKQCQAPWFQSSSFFEAS